MLRGVKLMGRASCWRKHMDSWAWIWWNFKKVCNSWSYQKSLGQKMMLWIHIKGYKDTKNIQDAGIPTDTLFGVHYSFHYLYFWQDLRPCPLILNLCAVGVFKLSPRVTWMAFRLATSSAQPTQLTKQIATYPKTFPKIPHPLIQEKTDTHRFLN